jgi:L-asparaginase
MVRARILIVYVGGTIGMKPGPSGLVPSAVFAEELMRWLERDHDVRISHDAAVHLLEPLIDSAEAVPANWRSVAHHVWANHDGCDGVVVLHGTDTLAYTASALSFLLIGLGKPVILTGAQVPFGFPGSDAEANIRGAVACALDGRIREVAIFFDGVLLRGNRARKSSTHIGDGFTSPHWPELARFNGRLDIAPNALLPVEPFPRPLPVAETEPVGLLKVYPGISEQMIIAAADAHPRGLVLELYGSGTAPALNRPVRRALETVTRRKTPMVGVSQCLHGEISPACYASSHLLRDAGVVSGHDLTAEAALAKLTYLNGLRTPFERLAGEIARPLAGELTPEQGGLIGL